MKDDRWCYRCKYYHRIDGKSGDCEIEQKKVHNTSICKQYESNGKAVKRKSKFLWMKVTNDEYELPLCVCDTAHELAVREGIPYNLINSAIYHAECRNGKSRFVKVKVEE